MYSVIFALFVTSQAYALENMSTYNKLWDSRDKGGSTDTALSQLNDAYAMNANDYDLHWNLARFYYWAATETKDSERAAVLAKKGWQAAEQTKRVSPHRIEGWYWATANIGIYADAAGTFVTVKEDLSTKYKENADQAIELDPSYDDGGPYRSLGIYYTKLPWPMQDLDQARELIGRSLSANPNRALSLYYYAEVQIQSGDTEEGQRNLYKIIHLDPEQGNAPEIRRYQILAQQRLRTISD